jgi:hypothetical protein
MRSAGQQVDQKNGEKSIPSKIVHSTVDFHRVSCWF